MAAGAGVAGALLDAGAAEGAACADGSTGGLPSLPRRPREAGSGLPSPLLSMAMLSCPPARSTTGRPCRRPSRRARGGRGGRGARSCVGGRAAVEVVPGVDLVCAGRVVLALGRACRSRKYSIAFDHAGVVVAALAAAHAAARRRSTRTCRACRRGSGPRCGRSRGPSLVEDAADVGLAVAVGVRASTLLPAHAAVLVVRASVGDAAPGAFEVPHRDRSVRADPQRLPRGRRRARPNRLTSKRAGAVRIMAHGATIRAAWVRAARRAPDGAMGAGRAGETGLRCRELRSRTYVHVCSHSATPMLVFCTIPALWSGACGLG